MDASNHANVFHECGNDTETTCSDVLFVDLIIAPPQGRVLTNFLPTTSGLIHTAVPLDNSSRSRERDRDYSQI